MRGDTWRDTAKRVIAKVIEQNPDADFKTFKKLLQDAYPFGKREHFPYKVWCDQQKRTLSLLYPNRSGRMTLMPSEGLFSEENLTAEQTRETHYGQ